MQSLSLMLSGELQYLVSLVIIRETSLIPQRVNVQLSN